MLKYLQIFVILLMVLKGSQGFADSLVLLTENNPPFNFMSVDDVNVTGIATDILREMANRAHIDVTIRMNPWKRALIAAESDESTCVYSAFRTAEREAQYKWIGPLISDNVALFARADRDIRVSSFDDVKNYVVGTYNGSAYIPLLEEKGIRFDIAPDNQSNLRKLAIDRIDLWVVSLSAGPYLAKQSGAVNVKPVFIFGNAKDYGMYLACNRGLSETIVTTLNGILKQMRHDGTYARILKNYQ